MNADKTKIVLFESRNKKATVKIELKMNGINIEKVNEIKFLGLTIHKNLSWKSRMLNILTKIRTSLGVIRRIKPNLNRAALITLYHSLIEIHIRYCIPIWKHGNTALSKQIQYISTKYLKLLGSYNKNEFGN